ncbi:hypothetical protein [Aeromonas caviae]|uniref:hypothetical protein n=1 Tax=Aeromonas caviae TaxID=648 RepID=UPI003977C51A
MIRHLLPDRRAGDDDMLARQTLQPTDDDQAQGITQQRLIDVAPLVLDAGGAVSQDPEIRALRPQQRLDPIDLFSRAGRKMYPLLRHGGNHLGKQGSVVIPLLYEAGAVHVRDDEFDHAVTSDVCMLIAVIISPQ